MSTIVLTGATGFLGRPLVEALAREGHQPVVLTRGAPPASPASAVAPVRFVEWRPDGSVGAWASELEAADAVVNLAGEPIAGRRWSAEQKARIRDSRVQATRSIVDALGRASRRPRVLVNGSAVGFYGPCGDETITEASSPGRDFLGRVCVEWETEAMRAATAGTRVVCLRTGLVLARDGGALRKMLPPFWFGLGGPVGSGRQFWPWIHRHDWIDLVRFALKTPAVAGPFNATAPEPVTSGEFARALGRAIRRPAFLPAPGFALKLALGEMADALLLSGQRAKPAKAVELGYEFTYPTLDQALSAIFAT
jgi:uncharacterized protein (TIGR01777 family)